ncbi:MAG: hypothetical protein K2Y56_09405 [Methylobacterium sp.]|uniref:hypothetical protein n=1 Tax=Methylobacterium sp. TaxID=409 RepID=UPI0025E02481|nr:hypothetical protein [Methylobacterium sp.]MBX9931737.1 hypothetical protein [Methylobacterium sp.]
MKTLILSTCALALSSFFLVQMSTEADARSRTKKRGMGVTSSQNVTGGRRSIGDSAVGGNLNQPSRGGRSTGSTGGASGSAGGS